MMEPAQTLETWWDCQNPMPEIAGILAVMERQLALAGDKVGAKKKPLGAKAHEDAGPSHPAYLGLEEDARQYVVGRVKAKHEGSRFPAFWGPDYDWVQDQDQGGVLLTALQVMLMQADGRKILLLPAWPKDCDVDFKLHALYRTVVSVRFKQGKVVRLSIQPALRKKDVLVVDTE